MKLSDIKLRKYHLDYYKLSDENLHNDEIGRDNAWCSPEHFEKYLGNASGSVIVSKYDFPLTIDDIMEVYSAGDFNVDEETFRAMIWAWKDEIDELLGYYDIELGPEGAGDEREIRFEYLNNLKIFLSKYTYHLAENGTGMAEDGSKGELVTFESLKDNIDIDISSGAVYEREGFDGEDYFDEIDTFIEYKCEHPYNKFNFNENKLTIENALKALNSEED